MLHHAKFATKKTKNKPDEKSQIYFEKDLDFLAFIWYIDMIIGGDHKDRAEHHQECREPNLACEHVKEEAHSDAEDEHTSNTEAKAFNRACHLHAQVKLFEPFELAFLLGHIFSSDAFDVLVFCRRIIVTKRVVFHNTPVLSFHGSYLPNAVCRFYTGIISVACFRKICVLFVFC
jgi:hypothetical protein